MEPTTKSLPITPALQAPLGASASPSIGARNSPTLHPNADAASPRVLPPDQIVETSPAHLAEVRTLGMEPVKWEAVPRGTQPLFKEVRLAAKPFLGSGERASVYLLHTDNPDIPFVAAKVFLPDNAFALDDEFTGLCKVLHQAGAYKGVVRPYGIATVPTPEGPQRSLLESVVHPSVTGETVLKTLRTMKLPQQQRESAERLFFRWGGKDLLHVKKARMTHADFKLDNVLAGLDARPVLIDFERWADDDSKVQFGGAIEYEPPEYADKEVGYDNGAYDAFTLGAAVVNGIDGHRRPPTEDGFDVLHPNKGVYRGEVSYIDHEGVERTERTNIEDSPYTEFVDGLMKPDPDERLTLEQALQLPYTKELPVGKEASKATLRQAVALALQERKPGA